MVEREIYIIELISRLIFFRSTVVKLYLRPESAEEPILHNTIEHAEPIRVDEPASLFLFQETTPQLVLKRGRGRLYKYPLLIIIIDITIYLQDNTTRFSVSCQKELTGLLEKGVFEITKLANIP
jgi:hypothetical protein